MTGVERLAEGRLRSLKAAGARSIRVGAFPCAPARHLAHLEESMLLPFLRSLFLPKVLSRISRPGFQWKMDRMRSNDPLVWIDCEVSTRLESTPRCNDLIQADDGP